MSNCQHQRNRDDCGYCQQADIQRENRRIEEMDRLRAEVDSLTKANAILKQGVQDLCFRHESEVEALKAARDQAIEAANQHAAMRQKAEQSALAIALECREYKELAASGIGCNCFAPGDKTCNTCRTLSRPASFWTRKAEAMSNLIESIRVYKNSEPTTRAYAWKCVVDDLTALDSIVEDR